VSRRCESGAERSRWSGFCSSRAASFCRWAWRLILLGWYGAAHTTYLEEQVPYLISGGVLGLALAAIGGFFYFGFLADQTGQRDRRNYEEQASESRRQHDQLIAVLSRVESQLARQPVSRRPQRGGSTSEYNGSGGLTALVATTHGTMLHRSDCEIVANRGRSPYHASGYTWLHALPHLQPVGDLTPRRPHV